MSGIFFLYKYVNSLHLGLGVCRQQSLSFLKNRTSIPNFLEIGAVQQFNRESVTDRVTTSYKFIVLIAFDCVFTRVQIGYHDKDRKTDRQFLQNISIKVWVRIRLCVFINQPMSKKSGRLTPTEVVTGQLVLKCYYSKLEPR